MKDTNRKIVFVIALILVLTGFKGDGVLRTIIKDGKFARLPKDGHSIRSEIVPSNATRYGYLVFGASDLALSEWIEKAKVKVTSREELFLEDIIVWPHNRPDWFKEDLDNARDVTVYFKRRLDDKFIAIICHDVFHKRVLIEYVIGQ